MSFREYGTVQRSDCLDRFKINKRIDRLNDQLSFQLPVGRIKDNISRLGNAAAELENNFEKIYSLVFQKMSESEDTNVEDFLLIFGAVGG